ncbi:MAG: DUF4157 domain-containing protein [Lewinellaceae bacterium]|nr:DUF4157 domain-containing protein [Lewinellaceae bacterium]
MPTFAPQLRGRQPSGPDMPRNASLGLAKQRHTRDRTQQKQAEGHPANRSSIGHHHDFSRIPIFSPSPTRIQPKLKVNKPGDEYEREADRMADQVMRMGDVAAGSAAPGLSGVQRKCAACESGGAPCPKCAEEEGKGLVQTKAQGTGGAAVSPALAGQIQHARGGGQALDTGARSFMESRFGRDFSGIRIHADNQAAQMSRQLNAEAFTIGRDIYFNNGYFSPESSQGKQLLAHELAHAVQQGAAGRLSNGLQEPVAVQAGETGHMIQRRTLGVAGACWFENCDAQLQNFFMIPEDGPPGFHPSGSGSFRVDDVDGLWFKYHSPKSEWFKIPDIGTGQVTCTDDEQAPNIRSPIIPFATAGWVDDSIHTPNPF